MSSISTWSLDDVSVGDYIEVQIVNKKGDCNLDGMILCGRIKDIVPKHSMVRLESGWCCHTKDRLLKLEPIRSKDIIKC